MASTMAAGFLIYRTQPSLQFLLLQTSYGKNHWTPPKGHVDPGEDLLTAAKRETLEEAGIDSKQLDIHNDFDIDLQYLVKDQPKIVRYWLAKLKNPTAPIKLSKEHQAFAWCTFDEAWAKGDFPEQRRLLSEAREFLEKSKKSTFMT